jgi:alpha-galactosidase
MKNTWFKEHLADGKSDLPFSFTYDGQPSAKLLTEWPAKVENQRLDEHRTRRTITWTDPKTGLDVRCVAVDYADYPALEWTVWFRNTDKGDTPILKDIQGLDATFTRSAQGEFVLHGNKGDWNVAEGFEPYRRTLAPGSARRFAPNGGRPTNGPNGWPYYNVQWTGGGVMLAIGWPSQWIASFSRDEHTALRITAGQELTHLSLKPGEEIRSPLIALLFWQGDDVVPAQNLWRRWFMTHNIPKIDGKPPTPMAQMQLAPTCTGSEQEQFAEVKKFEDAGIEIDLYWNDAGWYPCGGKWPNTGTWEIDASRYPNGFKPIADRVHAKGKKLIVWFEPERVGDQNSWLARNHPEWLLGGTLVNLGNPEARQWVIERVDSIIKTNGIDYYRQDFNMDPLGHWRGNDSPNRQGMTENLHVQGYLAFWDELRRRHPAMLIDTCASGGRRLDLETLRRSVPLLRSDFQPAKQWEAQHGQTYGLSSWVSYYGSGVYAVDKYHARSFYMPGFGLGGNQDLQKSKVFFAEWRQIAPLMLGDYYPLTPYSLKLDQWIAWQFDRSEQGDGVVQAFRRDQCETGTQTYRLRGLDSAMTYEVTNFDRKENVRSNGKDLMEKGLPVEIADKPGAAVIVYRKIQPSR